MTFEDSEPESDLGRLAVRAVGWAALQKWSSRLTSLLAFLLLARLLQPEDFGLIAIASIFVGLTNVLSDGGFGTYLVQVTEIDKRTTSTSFWTTIVTSVLLAGLLCAAAPGLAALLGEDKLTAVLLVLALSIPIQALSVTPAALLRRQLQFRALALRGFVATISSAAVAVGMAFAGFGVWSLVAQALVNGAVSAAVLWTVSTWRPSRAYDRLTAMRMYRFGFNVVGIQLLQYLRTRGDELIVAAALGTSAVGLYSVAKRILVIVMDLTTSVVSAVATPVFARVKADPERLRRAYAEAVTATSVFVAPTTFALAALSPILVPAAFGPQWRSAGDLSAILALSGAVAAVSYFDRGLLLALGRAGTELLLTAAVTGSSLLVALLTAPFGLTTLAVALVLRAYLMWPVRLLTQQRITGVRMLPVLRPVVRVWIAAGIPAALAGVTAPQLRADIGGGATCLLLIPAITALYLFLLGRLASDVSGTVAGRLPAGLRRSKWSRPFLILAGAA